MERGLDRLRRGGATGARHLCPSLLCRSAGLRRHLRSLRRPTRHFEPVPSDWQDWQVGTDRQAVGTDIPFCIASSVRADISQSSQPFQQLHQSAEFLTVRLGVAIIPPGVTRAGGGVAEPSPPSAASCYCCCRSVRCSSVQRNLKALPGHFCGCPGHYVAPNYVSAPY